MRLSQSVRLGASILVALNLLMAFGSIWVFMRMAPAIEIIIDQNARSLHACEEMLSSLALANRLEDDTASLEQSFSSALDRARGNITDPDEPDVLETIKTHYAKAFSGDTGARKKTVSAIRQLSEINREAMVRADWKARQFGNAGAWGIVFMATAVFLVGMLFLRGLTRNLVKPMEEIHSVIQGIARGDTMRRCTGADMPQDIKKVFNGINDLLDKTISSSQIEKEH